MTCDVCGFRPELYTSQDLRGTTVMAPHVARQLLSGAPPALRAELTAVLATLDELDPDAPGVEAVHDAMHRLHEAGRLLHASTARHTGTVVQVSASGGGVPKRPLPSAVIGLHGLEGDVQADRRNHGRPWQAVSLWSAEVIEGLQAEGHPIGFGSAGENLTVRGLDWPRLTPGVRLQAGSALLQVTSYAIPCEKNAGWFSDGGFRRMAHEVRPGRSRLYALVLVPGSVSPGDDVVVEP